MARRRGVIAWTLVGVQFVLIGLVVLPSRGDAWPVPAWLRAACGVMTWSGVLVMLVAGLSLRRGLTAAPLPNAHAQLRTRGFYRFVRHPIYSGLLLFTSAETLASGRIAAAAVGVLLLALINVKVRWEEARLVERFPEYADYARRTPRFIPGARPAQVQS